ncbi:lymphotoxin-beta-like [Rhincodon typus]|uniref:lymphotoxin-beta-like n=1 Tax=Rhincodon typus TaxID=259920 RepID=UPI00202EA838|nr:lymphotoxin-beta-like [Rhincodon typus]
MTGSEKAADGAAGRLAPVLGTALLTLGLSVPTTALLVIYFRCGGQPGHPEQIPHNASMVKGHLERISESDEQWELRGSEKPAAHLIGIYHHSLKDSSSAHFHRTLEWESVRGLAFTKDSVRYLGRSLVIPKRGLYYVYCQVGFRGSECKNRPVTLYNRVYRKHDSYPEPLLLLSGTETVCGKNHNKGSWYTTLGQGAVVELERDHQLFVNVSNPHLVDYLDGKTFFGVIKI